MKHMFRPTGALARLARSAAVTLLGIGCAFAQAQAFPDKPLTLVVGFPPGGFLRHGDA